MFGHNMITHCEILPVNLEIRGHSLPYGLTEDLAGNRQELYATLVHTRPQILLLGKFYQELQRPTLGNVFHIPDLVQKGVEDLS